MFFYKGSGTMFFHDVYDSIVVVDKFCSLENYNLTEGQFVDFHSSINATITRRSILNGGSTATSTAMIVQNYGDSVLSYTNITHCYSKQDAAFVYGNVQSSANISYCQIEKIDSDDRLSTIDNCLGYIERSHYLNNTQNASDKGIITVNVQTLEIYDSLFLNNQQNEIGYLFDADDYGSITICRCFIQQDINYWNDEISDKFEITDKRPGKFTNDLWFDGAITCYSPIKYKQSEQKKFRDMHAKAALFISKRFSSS